MDGAYFNPKKRKPLMNTGKVVADLGKSLGGSVGGTIGRAIVRGALGGILRR